MRHRYRLLLVLLMTVGLVAVSAAPVPADQVRDRPLQVSLEAEFEVVGVCDSGAPQSSISGSGIASHMGAITVEGGQCMGEPGVVTWTAANGDEITIVFVTVLLAPPGADGSAPFVMPALDVEGTGRFENVALDGGALTGTIWFESDGGGHLEGAIDGTIVYDASDRSDR